ncbi:MAG: HAMP domain-containing protein [Spirulina sp. SIO3F2]|nr:HAMP domain-containing protein [Spirulina sp. SIO3F2]
MRIATKLLTSSGLIIAVIITFFGGGTLLSQRIGRKAEIQHKKTLLIVNRVLGLKISLQNEISYLKDYLFLDESSTQMAKFQKEKSNLVLALEQLQKQLPDSLTVKSIQARHKTLIQLSDMLRDGGDSLAEIKQDISTIDAYGRDINYLIDNLIEDAIAQEEFAYQRVKRLESWLFIAQYTSILVILVLLAWQFKQIFLPLIQSIRDLKLGVTEIGTGQFQKRVTIETGDEIEELAYDFNLMAQQLEESYHSLEAKVDERTAQFKKANQALTQTLQELRQTQGQLIQNEKMSSLGQLVAGVAHEINNPVGFIYGNSTHIAGYVADLFEIINCYEQQYPNPHPVVLSLYEELEIDYLKTDLPEAVKSMKLGADRIREIVLSLRNFSRLDEAETKEADIHEGLDNTLMILQNRTKFQAKRPAIKIRKDYGEIPLFYCYPGQLNQVFMNILSNSIDALEEYHRNRVETNQISEAPLEIQIKTQQVSTPVAHSMLEVENWIQITIADNGPGISESVLNKLFDPFFTTKKVGKGTGLGLSISYQIIVEKHGGDLRCESILGQGAKFFITLPMLKAGQILEPAIA